MWQWIQSGPDWNQILLFFRGSGLDPNPVLLEDADQDLNLVLPFQIIWGQNQHLLFGIHLNLGTKNAPVFTRTFFGGVFA